MKPHNFLLQALAVIAILISISVSCVSGGDIQVSAGVSHTVGLKLDGTVIATGSNYYFQCNVGSWTDIKQVDAGLYFTVGLKNDGTVVATGEKIDFIGRKGNEASISQVLDVGSRTDLDDGTWTDLDVETWTDIEQVALGESHVVGLKSDGTVIVEGIGVESEGDVGTWTDIQQVTAGKYHTVGLKRDGTVIAVGSNGAGQCEVGTWTDIHQVVAGYQHTVGLQSDGTVVAVGDNRDGQCDVGVWSNIQQVTAGSFHTAALKRDGTIVVVGNNGYSEGNLSDWDLLLSTKDSDSGNIPLDDGQVISVKISSGDLALQKTDITTPKDLGFIYAPLDISITNISAGSTVEIIVGLPAAAPKEASVYNLVDGKWINFNANCEFNSQRTSVTYQITDGGDGDNDNAEDGKILNPMGFVTAKQKSSDRSNNDSKSSSGGGGSGCYISSAF